MRGIDQRLDRLEELLNSSAARIGVIHQDEDGSWPDDPPGASLVIAIRSFRCAYQAAPNAFED